MTEMKYGSPEYQDSSLLLTKTNEYLRMAGNAGQLTELPEVSGLEDLAGKKILYVEDTPETLQAFIPQFVAATGGTADFILYKKQTLEQLAEEISERNPEILLIDGFLDTIKNGETISSIEGAEVCHAVQKLNPKIKCIGFSMGSAAGRQFEAADVPMVVKAGGKALKNLVNYLEEQEVGV